MFSILKLIKSFGFAFEGIIIAFKENQNLRFHAIFAVIVIILGYVLNISRVDFILILIMILLVFSAEMINAAIEEVVNLLVQEHRIGAKIAKDVSAGMVLLIAIGSAIVGFVIFIPYIFN